MIRMVDRLRIQTLRMAGLTLQEVAREVGVCRRSVQAVLKEPPMACLDVGPTPQSRGVGRPSKVAAFESFVAELLETEPRLPTVEVLHRLRCRGYGGGKSALYELVKGLRRPRQKGSVENLVGWVKGSFFKVRRFHDREDVEGQLPEWLVEVNTVRPRPSA